MEKVEIGLLAIAWVLLVVVSWQDNRHWKSMQDAFKKAFSSWQLDTGGYDELPPFAYEELLAHVEAVAQSNTACTGRLAAWLRGFKGY